jgi:DNA-binding response OmpR family regulator
MTRVLVVEDDPAIREGLTDNLAFEQYDVIAAPDGETAYTLIHDRRPDVVLLDLMLPQMSGYDLCRKVRAEGWSMPIVMVTARGEETDRIRGLDLGADDYISKPFSVGELLARVRAVLRRAQAAGHRTHVLRFDGIVVDFRRFEATRDGVPIDLTRKEFGLLRLLVARAGEVVTRDELLDEVWGYDAMPTTRTVDTHVASLRAKIEPHPDTPSHLMTVRGVGYKWVQ